MTYNLTRGLAACLLMGASSVAAAPATDIGARYVEEMNSADINRLPVAPLSKVAPEISLTESYKIQDMLIESRLAAGERISGYKAGLVKPGQRLGERPATAIFGALFQSGEKEPGALINRSSFRLLVVEGEIAYTFARPVRSTVGSVEELRQMVASIRPAVELPDLSLDAPIQSEQDLVAINVGSAAYIFGRTFPPDTPVRALEAALTRNGETLTYGGLQDAVGESWPNLLKLVNLIVSHGHGIEAGQTILSGAIFAVPNPQAGSYAADFGALGTIKFDVVE